jgi:hypothetical protein
MGMTRATPLGWVHMDLYIWPVACTSAPVMAPSGDVELGKHKTRMLADTV